MVKIYGQNLDSNGGIKTSYRSLNVEYSSVWEIMKISTYAWRLWALSC